MDKQPNGHSNVHADKAERWYDGHGIIQSSPDIARIPIEGGATVVTTRPLPPLALKQREWIEIGIKMGWLSEQPVTPEVRTHFAGVNAKYDIHIAHVEKGTLQ
jgi:hypothetical protein